MHGRAKNHGIVLPDADLDQAVADIIGAACGSAGERCMALPVVTPVGESTAMALREEVGVEIAKLRVGTATDPDAHYGPVVSAEHKARVEAYIAMAAAEGAEIVVDGRGFELQGHEAGYYLAPTLIDRVTADMRSYQDEIFGPVLQILRAETLEEAIEYPSRHQYGNGVAIFTRNGDYAQGSHRRSRSAWSASTSRSRCPSPITVSAAGSARASATSTNMEWTASASTRGPRRSRSAGLRAARSSTRASSFRRCARICTGKRREGGTIRCRPARRGPSVQDVRAVAGCWFGARQLCALFSRRKKRPAWPFS